MFGKEMRRQLKFFSKYPRFNAFVHILAGIGFGILLTYPMVQTHPVRWAALFFALSILGHLWAMR